ncbi:hypothetical protein CICLE_v10020727mg [Citrus x clementina]|uniref:Phosphoglycerate mutase-like protein AT74H n=1 Tax=Citrus clementina TaxID=85681 RepID=V4TS74_CITCL|nr:hypothetical protein CICLE_v10020727mg [Citrus x clementina]
MREVWPNNGKLVRIKRKTSEIRWQWPPFSSPQLRIQHQRQHFPDNFSDENQTVITHLNSNVAIKQQRPFIYTKVMERPRRIILVRHGESEGNVDESAYTRVADPKIALTEKGKAQSEECGRRIRQMIEQNDGDGAELDDDWQVYFYVSPYTRTLQTLQFLGRAFERSRIAGMTKEPRLREQDFGNFQDRERMRVEKAVRLLYGRFFYRFPKGKFAADFYDKITGTVTKLTLKIENATGFRETLRADIDHGRFQPPGHRSQNMNIVIVSHGLTLRVFLMRWYKWTVEQFEGLNNLGNGGIIVMEKGYGGRYSLLVHHTEEELREFGLTYEMLIDQEWQKYARLEDINYDCPLLNSFFTHLDDGQCII